MTVAEVERIGAPDIPVADAKAAFLAYRTELLRECNPKLRGELGTLMRSYRAIAAGKHVVDVERAIKAAGLQRDTHYPRLAICRADVQWCYLVMKDDGSALLTTRRLGWNERIGADHVVRMPVDTFERRRFPSEGNPNGGNRPRGWSNTAKALVPIVPPQHRPPAYTLAAYHLLWDAVWTPEPPVDPMLLKHLGGPLYAVMAAWDLSPLERAVMRGRL